jgi:hypothetical protein
MKAAARLVSWVSLFGTIIPPIMFFAGWMTLDVMKVWMTAATVAWFVATPIWME